MDRRHFLSALAAGTLDGEPAPVQRARAELQRWLPGHFEQITLQVTSEFGREGFRLRSDGQKVRIEGSAGRGLLYGVYEFLDRLGFRWYAEDCGAVPPAIRFPKMDEVCRPAFEYREVFMKEAGGKDWAVRNRVNGGHTDLDDSTGGKVSYYPFGHSFEMLVPPQKYFADHPEYFSLVGGYRRAVNSQLCLSNREVLRIATDGVLRWMAEHPEASLYSVSQNDEDAWCECAECRRIEEEEGAHSGPILRFVNAIAEVTSRKYPDKWIDTFAYRYSEKPPGKSRAHPNVRVRMAPICACQAHPYEKCPHNGFVMDHLRGWARVSDKLYVWHYIVNFNQYLLPFPNLDELSADVAMYRRHNVVGVFFQGGKSQGGGTELAELRSWLLARLLWNPSLDPERLIREFVGAYYGAAAPAMMDYLRLMHRDVRRGKSLFLYRGPAFSPEFRREAGKCFDRMSAAVRGDAIRRVDKARLAIDWYDLYQAKRARLEGQTYGPRDPRDYWRRYDALREKARAFGYTDFCEWGSIETIEAEDRQFIREHRTVTLENRFLRVVLVPSFHGRIIHLVDRQRRVETLRLADPDERFTALEALGGLVLYAHPEQFSRPRYDIAWEVEEQKSPERLVLRGVCANGLQLRRTLELDAHGPLLRTVTNAENRGQQEIPLTLHSRAEIYPGDLENPAVEFSYPMPGGRRFRQTIFPPPDIPLGDLFLGGEGKPMGEWQLGNPGMGFALVNLFVREEADRFRLWWRGRRQAQANLGVWSPRKHLAPGESLPLRADYEIRNFS